MLENSKVITVNVRPLLMIEAEGVLVGLPEAGLPDYETIVKYLCRPDEDATIQGIIARYQEVSKIASQLFAVPIEEKIFLKLIWPLKHAVGSYMIGNYLGTIALCGLVVEMATMLLFEISPIPINDRPLGKDEGKILFGNTFERLGQKRRIDVLHAYNIITDDQAKSLNFIRKIRNQYLHFPPLGIQAPA